MFRQRVISGVVALVLAGCVLAANVRCEEHRFVISGALLREVARQGLIVELPVRFVASGGVHPVQNDCEMHWAAQSRIPLGDPAGLVTEPPNVCRTWPPSSSAGRGGRRFTWRDYAESSLMGRDCVVRGFPRLAAEHAGGGGSPATPAHIVEIHPLLAVRGPGVALDFARDLRAVSGMVHKRPEVSEPTVSGRRLWVRSAGDGYAIRDNGEGADWNFAIATVVAAATRVRAVRGGHALDARVRFRDDGPLLPLTLYTLTGTAADERAAGWLPRGEDWRVLGLLTYDPLALVATVQDARGAWRGLTAWTEVRRPLAFVVWGETSE